MTIIYISSLVSTSALNIVRRLSPDFCGYAAQKFNRLVVEGFSNNNVSVKVLSSFPNSSGFRRAVNKNEKEGGVSYKYIGAIRAKALNHFIVSIRCFIWVLLIGVKHPKETIMVCDVLNISACIGGLIAAKLLGLRRVGIVTDIPGYGVGDVKSLGHSFKTKLNLYFISHFSHYVLLTEKMNGCVNPHSRPYIVMEGLVDNNTRLSDKNEKYSKRIIIYAGGLYEQYGIKMLVDAFDGLDEDDIELWLYGDGQFVSSIIEYNRRNPKIVYKGICSNDVIVEEEKKATLLVNPRPTHEKYSELSFPSKNMEYMVSGTPLLTTQLPGMPEEYRQYVFVFDKGETVEGYKTVLKKVLSLSKDCLDAKGSLAQQWVLGNKNNIFQTRRILSLVNE